MGAVRLLRSARAVLVLAAAGGLMLLAAARPLGSWDQPPHRQINFEATKVFFEKLRAGESEKYRLGPITGEGRSALHRGIAVSSSTMFVKPVAGLAEDYRIGEERHSMEAWITLGGDWADEPHLYASVRHFYDPFQAAGAAYLTDQSWSHGKYDGPGIDQVSWALEHPDNPYSLRQGLTAYKLALETPEGEPPPSLGASHFKTNISIAPRDAADQRSIYLARAYRSLGEVMHMLGDMTQPAHVRNDSHPMDEPVETRTFSSDVSLAGSNPLIDGAIQPYLASAGGALQTPRGLAHQLAVFTNRNFYSMDTIFDSGSGVRPDNGMPPNASPQFGDLEARTFPVASAGFIRVVTRYYASIAGRDVPMIQERLSSHIFAADHSVIHDSELETFARLHGAFTGRVGPYHVPTAFAREQAAVLLPVAIHACADLMDLFFPTLELTAEYEQEDLVGAGEARRQVITVDPTVVHHQERDPAWKAFGLRIEYSGPGALVFSRDGTEETRRTLHFAKGRVKAFESSTGKMVEGPLKVYVPTGREALEGEEAFYAFEHRQQLHLEIDAGSRHFESAPYEVEPEVVIMPRAAVGPPGATFDFEAYSRPEGVYRYEWSWPGLAEPVVTEGVGSQVAPVLSEPGTHGFSVRLIHLDGTVLDEDHVTAHVEEDEEEAAPEPTPTPKPAPGRWVLVDQGSPRGRFSDRITVAGNEGLCVIEAFDVEWRKDVTFSALYRWSAPEPSIPVGSRVHLTYSVEDRSSPMSAEAISNQRAIDSADFRMRIGHFYEKKTGGRWFPVGYSRRDSSDTVDSKPLDLVELVIGGGTQSSSQSFTASDGSAGEGRLTVWVDIWCGAHNRRHQYVYELRP